jgi:hypothetical protein
MRLVSGFCRRISARELRTEIAILGYGIVTMTHRCSSFVVIISVVVVAGAVHSVVTIITPSAHNDADSYGNDDARDNDAGD